ncbi:MAG: hypothetical protein E6X17_10595 [Sporomusaceae bacterium]|nr:hypothetical protein [Sporomusaceae bacterium]
MANMVYLVFNWNGQLLLPAGEQTDGFLQGPDDSRPIPLNANCF